MPSVSVIIPAYRAEKFIVRTVTSLFAQTLTDWEAIIVSDDKFDYQKFLAKNNITDKRLRFGNTGKVGSGPSNARNIAQDMAKSNIIATLDADDTFDKRKLEMSVPMAQKHGLVGSNMKIIDDKTSKELPYIQYTPHSRLIKFNELIVACANVNIVYKQPKRKIYWSDKIKYREDLLFVCQLYDHYGKAFYFRHKLYNYYFHSESLCRINGSIGSFDRDREILISMLQENESYIKDKCNRHMLISILNVGHEIDKKHGNNRISHEEYNKEVRLFCPFLPNRRIWKHKSENI